MRIWMISILCVILLLSGCGTSIEDIKTNPDDYLGEKVKLSGTAKGVTKIGKLSGFSLKDGDYSIMVSSDNLPTEGSKVKVKGTVMKNIVSYYILADYVR